MNVNFLVEDMGSSQLAYKLIRCANGLVADGYPVVTFYEQMSRHILRPAFPAMQIVEAWAQPGITIATSINTAVNLIDFPGPKYKLFYIWDIEWLRGPQRIWGALYDLFNHESLQLIARTDEYATIIHNAFNRKPEFIMENFELSTMKGILADVTTRE